MKRIFKYAIRITDVQRIHMQVGAEVCYVGLDPDGNHCIWAIVDPEAPMEWVTVLVIGTGHPIPDEVIFLGSMVAAPFVWHVFIQP